MSYITEIKQGETARIAGWRGSKSKNSSEAAVGGSGLGRGVGVSCFVKKEFRETGPRTELAILGALEWSAQHSLCQGVCIKGGKAIFSGIVDRDPFCLERLAEGVKVFDVRGQDVRIRHPGMEHNRMACGRRINNLQDLEFPAQLQICRIVRY